MKPTFTLFFLFLSIVQLRGQGIDEIASRDLKHAIPLFERVSDFENTDNADIVGLGDIAQLAKESKKINTGFAAYLIENKNFRNIMLPVDDWLIRPLNASLTGHSQNEDSLVDSLAKTLLSAHPNYHSYEFRTFLKWIKEYNAAHPADMVTVNGAAPLTRIPASYFLAHYVYIIDQEYGKALSERWSRSMPGDSIVHDNLQTWIDAQKSKQLTTSERVLITRCEADLLHNKSIVPIHSIDEKFPAALLDKRSQYIADNIGKKSARKTIFFGSNTEVAAAKLQASYVLGKETFGSVGSFLKNRLGERYIVFVTDFTGSAELPIADMATQTVNIEIIQAKDQSKRLKDRDSYLNREKHQNHLDGYEPTAFSAFKEMDSYVISEKDKDSVDAVFVVSDLSPLDFFD
jgi:hypothetical protein